MVPRHLLVLMLPVLLAGGCRFGVVAYTNAGPRATTAIKLGLRVNSVAAGEVVREVFGPDPRLTYTEASSCEDAGSKGLDYFASASLGGDVAYNTVCDKRSGTLINAIFDAKEGECIESHRENVRGTGGFGLRVQNAKTCSYISTMSVHVSTESGAGGSDEETKVLALSEAAQLAKGNHRRFPDQLELTADGTLVGEGGHPGMFAAYRGGEYLGEAMLEVVGTSRGRIRPLRCCFTPSPGDKFVARGPTRYVELMPAVVAGLITKGGDRQGAIGPGIWLRSYVLPHGLVFGAGAEILRGAGARTSVGLLQGEVGWGFHPSPVWHLTAAVQFGYGYANQHLSATEMGPTAHALHASVIARGLYQVSRYWYVGGELGYLHTGAFEDWAGAFWANLLMQPKRKPCCKCSLGSSIRCSQPWYCLTRKAASNWLAAMCRRCYLTCLMPPILPPTSLQASRLARLAATAYRAWQRGLSSA